MGYNNIQPIHPTKFKSTFMRDIYELIVPIW